MYKNFDSNDLSYREFFFTTAEDFGGKGRSGLKYVARKNVNDPFPAKGAYFGCISEGEEKTGAYSDLSIVVFPSNEADDLQDRWMIALVVGSLGFKNDYDLVTLPGTRRMFTKHLLGNDLTKESFVKNDFLDVESQDGFKSFCDNNEIPDTLANAIKNYGKVILAASVINPNDELACKETIGRYLALYAIVRDWPTSNAKRKKVQEAIAIDDNKLNEEAEIKKLLSQRKYVVLQGAPGTGKTRMAKKITAESSNVFFTQFHAETSYSDFVYGILPNVNAENLQYQAHEGIFVQAIKTAQAKPDEPVYLIIDEINRANLASVLGPAFYLFEPTMANSGVKIEVCPGLALAKLPENLYVIATMNNADRSLAVVDFALRRRFAWYTMVPHTVKPDSGYKFCQEEFNDISDIFEKYATDEELNLQPGQAYFIVSEHDQGDEIKTRLQYEVMPLIKEYLANGMLARSKDDFVDYFRRTIHEEMFR